jgi:2-polyprenyl-3-methyl-5-hydroxy-6-metoxy-1,4-benzoquinol methylase
MMDIKDAKELNECLCCGSEQIKLVLDLNEQPLANSFKKTAEEAEPTFPLRLNICEDCTHLQLSHAVNPDLLFKNYLYVSGTSQTLRDYFDWFAKETLNYFSEPPKTVLDIACNDGSQLNSFKALGLKTFGVDPAENLHELSNANHEVVCDYFKEKYVYHYKMKQLDIITAQNVFAHNDYPLDFLLQCKEIMHDGSFLFIQTSQADMIRNNEFDTIYHEHLSFFNASSMSALAKRAGLYLIDIRKTPIHGNSYMFVFSKVAGDTSKVDAVLAEEQAQGLQDMNTYLAYADRASTIVEDLKQTIMHYRTMDYLIVGYGAAAKGNTLLNFGEIHLDYIIDDNPLKQGLYSPGMSTPVVPITKLDDYTDTKVAFVPLAWNFFTEIRRNIKNKRDREGDVFIKYFPTISVE